uniref:G_PROTEIN_RECEP_F1_2 domain-containing protein n=1 Tax=Meloidogyne hapla TaxID=6305 RepID=A0A1I8BUU1_MELHA
MDGKGIRLSKRYVICLFSCVWLLLIISHISFSALQYFAVSELHRLLNQLKTTVGFYLCNRNDRYSVFSEIGERCDSISVFHDFGHFLLRGHTLFTLFFLFVSIAIFLVTICCHWRVNLQHEMLSRNSRNGRKREHSPYRRRETLFNTLLLSLGAFFISVSGQSFVEIAVFWVSDRRDVTRLAAVYQLFRIAAFIDPLLNPLLVAVRTPAIRRKLRYYFYLTLRIFCTIFCPCWRKELLPKHKRGRDSVVVAKRRRQSSSLPYVKPISSAAARRGSSGSYLSSNGSEKGISKFGLLCSGRVKKLEISKFLTNYSSFETNSIEKTVVQLK